MVLSSPGPRVATMPMASRVAGKAIMISMMRMATMSVMPPRKPDARPTELPTTRARLTAMMPTRSEMLAPKSTRRKTSRPWSSVPKMLATEGPFRRFARSLSMRGVVVHQQRHKDADEDEGKDDDESGAGIGAALQAPHGVAPQGGLLAGLAQGQR